LPKFEILAGTENERLRQNLVKTHGLFACVIDDVHF
jgi:hypothetical protein